MGLLRHIRSRSRIKGANGTAEAQIYNIRSSSPPQTSSQLASKFPRHVLVRIFSYVCPHVQDESYTTCEDSMLEEGCMLCQMRDLASCAYACRLWAGIVRDLLYHSVRLDAVHFCDREESTPRRRRLKGRSERNNDTQITTEERLKLFQHTVKESLSLGSRVEFLKLPFMTREACKADLARTVSVLPNLRYVDLPDGVYSDEHASLTLKQELESRCPELRTMKYLKGSEQTFAMIPRQRMWQKLEVLELQGLEVDADALLLALASFPALREAKLGGMMALNDELLTPNPNLPLFPPLERLIFDKTPAVTANGLAAYLSRPETKEVLSLLRLTETGVSIPELHLVLAAAPNLTDIFVSETVSRPFPLSAVPALAAPRLQKLFFGILPHNAFAHPPVSESFYNYLATSLLSSALPSLSSLYAYSDRLPDALFPRPYLPFADKHDPSKKLATAQFNPEYTLSKSSETAFHPFTTAPFSAPSTPAAPLATSLSPLLPPTIPALTSRISTHSIASSQSSASRPPADGHGTPALSFTGICRPLDLYTKSPAAPELEWSLTTLLPPSEHNGRRGSASATRPLSLIALEGSARQRDRSRSPGVQSAGKGSISGRSLGAGSAAGSTGGSISSMYGAASTSRRQSETTAGRVVVGNGFGGFLSVPGAEARREASGSGHSRQGSRSKGGDWMG